MFGARSYRNSPFDVFGFPRLSMHTRLMGFDDPFEEIEREVSRDPFFDLARTMRDVGPTLGVPLLMLRGQDAAQTEPMQEDLMKQAADAKDDVDPSQDRGKGKDNQLQAQPEQQQLMERGAQNWLSAYTRAPAVDVVERNNEFEINVDVPGVAKDDVKLQVTEDRRGRKLLTVSGERKENQEQEDKQRGFRSSHRLYGKFSRSLRLPDNCDCKANSIQAKHENGVLKVIVPKLSHDAVKPASMDIKIA